MKLTNLMRPEFNIAISKILDAKIENISPKLAFRFKRIESQLREQMKSMQELRLQMCTELCKKDEDGQPIKIPVENKPGAFEFDLTQEQKELIGKRIHDALESTEVDLGDLIPYDDIEKVGLTIGDIIMLDGLISEPRETPK